MLKNILVSALTVLIGTTQANAFETLTSMNNEVFYQAGNREHVALEIDDGSFTLDDYCDYEATQLKDNYQVRQGSLSFDDRYLGEWEQTLNQLMLFFDNGQQVIFYRQAPNCDL